MTKIATATFRPDSRDGSKDFEIPLEVGKQLFVDGKIARDATNGGFCPIPGKSYIPREHKVELRNARDPLPWLRR